MVFFNRPLAGAAETDMLENHLKDVPVMGNELIMEFRAFEIKTLVVIFRE